MLTAPIISSPSATLRSLSRWNVLKQMLSQDNQVLGVDHAVGIEVNDRIN
jgi:hypothetical protein